MPSAYRSVSGLALAVALLITGVAPAFAQSDPPPAKHDKYSGAPLPPSQKREVPSPLTDRFAIRASLFDSSLSTTLRVDDTATGLPGTPVSAERDLGLKGRVYQGRVEMYIRMRERSRLRVDYFESNRSGNNTLTQQVNFGGQTFLPGDLTFTSLDFRMFGLTYTYSLVKLERFELGAGLGVYLLQGDARAQVPARQLSQEVSGVAPFPTLAVDGTWRISTRFAFVARAQYLSDTVSTFTGALGDYHVDLQYRWRPNFALGLGYSQLRLSFAAIGGTFPGTVNFNVRGPEAFARVSF